MFLLFRNRIHVTSVSLVELGTGHHQSGHNQLATETNLEHSRRMDGGRNRVENGMLSVSPEGLWVRAVVVVVALVPPEPGAVCPEAACYYKLIQPNRNRKKNCMGKKENTPGEVASTMPGDRSSGSQLAS